jgi:hypothetical protein
LVSIHVGKVPLRDDRDYTCAADGGTVGSTGFFPEAREGSGTRESVHHALQEYLGASKGPILPPRDGRVERKVPGGREAR